MNELCIYFHLSFLLALSSVSFPFTVAKKLGQCVLLTSVHKLGMQWPDYLVNLLFHSYYFSSNSRPTPSFRPLTQQPNCLASFHPFESSSFKGASSLFTPSPAAYVAVQLLWLDFVPPASVHRLWIDWLDYNMTNRLWHNLCGRSLYEGLPVTRNLPAEIIGGQDIQWLPDIRIRYISNPNLKQPAIDSGIWSFSTD